MKAGEHELLSGKELDPSTRDRYPCAPMDELSDYGGRLFIEWGKAHRQWVQLGESSKAIFFELYDVYKEPAFPGHLELWGHYASVPTLPPSWAEISAELAGHLPADLPKDKRAIRRQS